MNAIDRPYLQWGICLIVKESLSINLSDRYAVTVKRMALLWDTYLGKCQSCVSSLNFRNLKVTFSITSRS